VPCALWVAPAETPAPDAEPASGEVWQLAEVRSGVAWVGAATTDAFVPQMLNYESIGGVNFKKGCYPGQEVVARSQFRGTLKRRAVLARAGHSLAPGDELFLASEPDQPAATVVQSAPGPQGGSEAILSGQISAFAGGSLHLGSANGPAVELRPAPYPLQEDISRLSALAGDACHVDVGNARLLQRLTHRQETQAGIEALGAAW
jgi:folate-binding protein YgfZ